MSTAPAGAPDSQRYSRPSEERIAQRFNALPQPSKTETAHHRRLAQTEEEGKRRVQENLHKLSKIRDVNVRETFKEVVRYGNLRADTLEKLISLSDKVPENVKIIINYLKKQDAAKKMKTIEEALRIDERERTEYETRRFVQQTMKTPSRRISFSSYGAITGKLYDLLRGNIYQEVPLPPEGSMGLFQKTRRIFSDLEALSKHSEGLTSKKERTGVFFGNEYETRQKRVAESERAARRSIPPPLPKKPPTGRQ